MAREGYESEPREDLIPTISIPANARGTATQDSNRDSNSDGYSKNQAQNNPWPFAHTLGGMKVFLDGLLVAISLR